MRAIIYSAIVTLFSTGVPARAQMPEKITIRFLNAAVTDTVNGKDVLAAFLVTTSDQANFPPVVQMPPKCTVFERGFEKKVLLHPHNTGASFDDENIEQKNPKVYALIKGQVDLSSMQNAMIVSYTIKDILYDFTKMSFTPAFKDKLDATVRVEQRFEFELK